MTQTDLSSRLVAELAMTGTSDQMALLSRMTRCGSEEWGGQFTCRTPACLSCRNRYIGQQYRKAADRFAKIDNTDLAFVTVVIGASTLVDDVGPLFAKFRKDFRNVVDSNRRQRRRWKSLETLTWLETDALRGSDYLLLAPERMAQIGELAPMFVLQDGPVWVATTHGVIAHPGIDIQEVRFELGRSWPGTKRVDVRPFYDHQTKEKNLRHTINYSLKHECRTHLGLVTEQWPLGWAAEYYAYLHGWSRGFQSLRMSIGKSIDQCTDDMENVTPHSVKEGMEPLPFTYSNSTFHTYYNWARNDR